MKRLSSGWMILSTLHTSASLLGWMAIVLFTFMAIFMADMLHFSVPLVVIVGFVALILIALLVMWWCGANKGTTVEANIESFDNAEIMSLIELRSEALNLGWDFSDGSEQTLEFTLLISQAGLDCEVQFWGRKDNADAIGVSNPIQCIPAGHWLEFAVEPVRFVSSVDNTLLRTYVFPGLEIKGYIDLYVDREQTLKWLETTAAESRNMCPMPVFSQ